MTEVKNWEALDTSQSIYLTNSQSSRDYLDTEVISGGEQDFKNFHWPAFLEVFQNIQNWSVFSRA